MRSARPEAMASFMSAGRTLSFLMPSTTFHSNIARSGICCSRVSSLNAGTCRAAHELKAAKRVKALLINSSFLGVTKNFAQIAFKNDALCRGGSSNAGSHHRMPAGGWAGGAPRSESLRMTIPWLLAAERHPSRVMIGDFRVKKEGHTNNARRLSLSTNGSNGAPSAPRCRGQPLGAVYGTSGAGGAGGRGDVTTGSGGRGAGHTASHGVDGRRRGSGPGTTRGLHDDAGGQPKPFREIPEDQLQVSFSRSSGAGGQNVNKLSTKVEIRFVVEEAEWLPRDVRLRLARHQSGRITSRGELVITSQEFRTQKQNRHAAMQKLREMIKEAWEPAKERKMRTGISKAGKEMRLAEKHRRAKVKSGRSKLSSKDYDD